MSNGWVGVPKMKYFDIITVHVWVGVCMLVGVHKMQDCVIITGGMGICTVTGCS